jgi:hypothetical protein
MRLSRDLEAKCLSLAAEPVARTQWYHHVEAGVPALPAISENMFMQQVIDYARSRGWKVYHVFDSRRSEPGFPDLLLVRRRLVMAELKTQTGKLTRAQREWLEALRQCGIAVYTWRPSDWRQIEMILQ